jgi:hypothetical protein
MDASGAASWRGDDGGNQRKPHDGDRAQRHYIRNLSPRLPGPRRRSFKAWLTGSGSLNRTACVDFTLEIGEIMRP